MRWKNEVWKIGDTRTVKRFLFFPYCVGRECRWLETGRILQQLVKGYNRRYWKDLSWVDEQAQEQEE